MGSTCNNNNKTPIINGTSGFFTKITVRMYGYDAAEKDTEAGQLAKKLMIDKFSSLNDIVWCQFIDETVGCDKYGRTLTLMYEDPNKHNLLNSYLFDMESIHNIKMVNVYVGGTKKGF